MQPRTLPIPDAARDGLARGLLIPLTAACEMYICAEPPVDCLVCAQPVQRTNDRDVRLAMVMIRGNDRHTDAFVRRLEGLITAAGLSLPSVRQLRLPGSQVLLAPWVFRGEFRAAVIAAVEPSGQGIESLLHASVLGPVSTPSRLDVEELRTALLDFAYPARSIAGRVRRLLTSRQRYRYELPMGCTVTELGSANGMVWSVNFKEMDHLERAQLAVESWLATRRPKHISTTQAAVASDADDSLLSEITLWAEEDIPEARQEMARLLKHLLLSLDRFSFEGEAQTELQG